MTHNQLIAELEMIECLINIYSTLDINRVKLLTIKKKELELSLLDILCLENDVYLESLKETRIA